MLKALTSPPGSGKGINRFLVLAVGLFLLFPLLAACSSSSGGATTASTSSASVPKSALCPGKQAASSVTVINWWEDWSNPNLLKSAQDFNCSHPNIAVNITVYPATGDDNQGKLLAAIAGHRPPDLVLSYDDVLAAWAGKGEIQQLDSQVKTAGIDPSSLVQPAWQSMQWQGHVYGIPVDWDPDTLLWYNKDIFKAVGLDPNKPPTTWQELQADAAKMDLVQNGKIQRLGFVPWQGWLFNFVEYGHLFNAGMQDGVDKTVALNTPGMQQAMQFEESYAKKFGGASNINSFAAPPNVTSGPNADPLIAGRVGMELIGDWELAQRQVVGADKFNSTLGVTTVPPGPGGQAYMCHSGWAFMVPRGSKNADASMQFVNWILQDNNFTTYMGSQLGWIPAKLSARQNSYYQNDPFWQQIIAASTKNGEGYWLPPSPVLSQYYQALETAESQVINLKKSPTQALTDADSTAQQALQSALSDGAYGS